MPCNYPGGYGLVFYDSFVENVRAVSNSRNHCIDACYGLHILDAIGIKIPRLLQSGLRLSTMLVKGV